MLQLTIGVADDFHDVLNGRHSHVEKGVGMGLHGDRKDRRAHNMVQRT